MEIIFKGVLSGVLLAFLIGPVFFTILQTSLERGFSCGAFVALGVSLSDAFYIFLTYLGLSSFINNPGFKVYLAYAGGVILLLFGAYYIFVKSRQAAYANPARMNNRGANHYYIAKGFLINGLSPMVLVFWIGTVSLATTELGYDTLPEASVYFCSIVGTVFITDLLKAKLADKLRNVLTPRFMRVMNIVLGIIFVAFGGRLIFLADQLSLL